MKTHFPSQSARRCPCHGLRRTITQGILHAVILLCVLTGREAKAQFYVSGYHYDEDTGGDFRVKKTTDYFFGVGLTNTGSTNITGGYIENPNITGRFSTNGCGWDTNGGGLSTIRQVDIVEQIDTGAYTNNYSGTEMWSGAAPDTGTDGYPAVALGSRNENVTLGYVTGGDTNNPLTRVYEIRIFDTKQSGQSFDPSEALVNGTNCNAEGKVYVTWTDCTTNIVTVTFPARTDVRFKADAGAMLPQIFLVQSFFDVDGNGNQTTNVITITNLVTGLTNTVSVGEKITLFCKFGNDPDVTPPNAPTISAWSWTIGGETISNYIANATEGTVHENYDKDKQSCGFYWKNGTTNTITVKCDATVNGKSLLVFTYVDVIKPSIPIDIYFGTLPTIDSLIQNQWNFRWGGVLVQNTNYLGFVYDYTHSVNWCVCEKISTLRQARRQGQAWHGIAGTGLDTKFPNFDYSDSPIQPLQWDDNELNDTFEVTLMFNPITPMSIWIPVKVSESFGWNCTAPTNSTTGGYTGSATCFPTNRPNGSLQISPTTTFPTWNKTFPNFQSF